jgi:hypothetical protein
MRFTNRVFQLKCKGKIHFIVFYMIIGIIGSSLRAQIANSKINFASFKIDTIGDNNHCYSFKPLPNYTCRWGFYLKEDIRKTQAEFEEMPGMQKKDSMVCIDYFGWHWVCLEATDAKGQHDTMCKEIRPKKTIISVPKSVFAVDYRMDNKPNVFKFSDDLLPVDSVHFIIYDRSGKKVFETKDKEEGWNGQLNNGKEACPDGTYYYIFKYHLTGRNSFETPVNGSAHMFHKF